MVRTTQTLRFRGNADHVVLAGYDNSQFAAYRDTSACPHGMRKSASKLA